MQHALGISEELADDLLAWHHSMTTKRNLGTTENLDDQGKQIATRLQAEVGTRFKVAFHGDRGGRQQMW